ncbi:MAG: hypothetical protein ACTTG8_06215 [Catonella sp.]|uniref:hypothetical protein n=1 Tax=Catonella sp. TaxID=2382125 RepID=UPI003F9F35F7
MADKKRYILDGYRFDDSESFEQGKREFNRITEIKSENDLKDETGLRQVYDSLVESEEFVTPIGIGFLREVQKRLVKNPEQRKTMKAIPFFSQMTDIKKEKIEEEKNKQEFPEKNTESDKSDNKSDDEESYIAIINNFKQKMRNYRIIVIFMAIMLIVPFGIVAYDKIFYSNELEEALVNEYASWKEELTKKEQELNERERLFEGIADKEINSEIKAGEENGESQNSGS